MKTAYEKNIFKTTPYAPRTLQVPARSPASPDVPEPGQLLTQLVYTPRELEPLLRLSKNTINALLQTGQLCAVRCGRKWLIPRDAVLQFLSQGERL